MERSILTVLKELIFVVVGFAEKADLSNWLSILNYGRGERPLQLGECSLCVLLAESHSTSRSPTLTLIS